MTAWVYLIVAGLLEVAWAIGLKQTEGWTRFWPSVVTGALMIGSFFFLSKAIAHEIPLGTGYAIWTGIGAVGTAIVGIIWFAEPASWPRLACVAVIVAGIVGLKVTSPQPARDKAMETPANAS